MDTVNGTYVWYYYICHRELWLIAHSIAPEQEDDNIAIGRHIHEIFYKDFNKEFLIDNTIKIDIVKDKLIGEVKKSSKFLLSAKMQVAFYLWYMKKQNGVLLDGIILIPEERKREKIILTTKLEIEVEKAIENIRKIIKLPKPPKPERISFCKICGYKEMCWV